MMVICVCAIHELNHTSLELEQYGQFMAIKCMVIIRNSKNEIQCLVKIKDKENSHSRCEHFDQEGLAGPEIFAVTQHRYPYDDE